MDDTKKAVGISNSQVIDLDKDDIKYNFNRDGILLIPIQYKILGTYLFYTQIRNFT